MLLETARREAAMKRADSADDGGSSGARSPGSPLDKLSSPVSSGKPLSEVRFTVV